jgi:hypothetical protein
MAGHEDQAQDVVLYVFDLRSEVGLIELLEDFPARARSVPAYARA